MKPVQQFFWWTLGNLLPETVEFPFNGSTVKFPLRTLLIVVALVGVCIASAFLTWKVVNYTSSKLLSVSFFVGIELLWLSAIGIFFCILLAMVDPELTKLKEIVSWIRIFLAVLANKGWEVITEVGNKGKR